MRLRLNVKILFGGETSRNRHLGGDLREIVLVAFQDAFNEVPLAFCRIELALDVISAVARKSRHGDVFTSAYGTGDVDRGFGLLGGPGFGRIRRIAAGQKHDVARTVFGFERIQTAFDAR